MGSARVTQIGRYVLTQESAPKVRVTQIARYVLYEFACEPGEPEPIPTPTPPLPDCPDIFLVDAPRKAVPPFLRTHGSGREGYTPSGDPVTIVPAPRSPFKR